MAEDRFTQLYRRYGPLIYARCRRILGDATLAEDATQETFLRVARHLPSAPTSEEALLWIRRIATNYCLNLREYEARRAEPHKLLPDPPAPEDTEALFARRDLLGRLIAEAPASLRAVAWLFYADGFEQEEIARILAISRRTVVNRLAAFKDHARRFARKAAR